MISIKLTQNKIAVIDDADLKLVERYAWQAFRHPNSRTLWYARCNIRTPSGRGHLYMHVLIMGVTGVDHINRDGLDNRRSNLRRASISQNKANQSRYKNNTSGYKGVHRHGNKWQARIGYHGKRVALGVFDTIEGAAKAYDKAAKEFFGEFANTNFHNSIEVPQ